MAKRFGEHVTYALSFNKKSIGVYLDNGVDNVPWAYPVSCYLFYRAYGLAILNAYSRRCYYPRRLSPSWYRAFIRRSTSTRADQNPVSPCLAQYNCYTLSESNVINSAAGKTLQDLKPVHTGDKSCQKRRQIVASLSPETATNVAENGNKSRCLRQHLLPETATFCLRFRHQLWQVLSHVITKA